MTLASPADRSGGGADTRPVRTRFAPSPTGFLHVGAFRTALFSWLLARKHEGQFLLRIEDTDQSRLVPGSLENILRSLRALGLDYDEGPDRASVARLDAAKYGTVAPDLLPEQADDYGPYFQSQKLARYDAVLEQLLEEGKAYYAFETEEQLEAARAAAKMQNVPFLYNRKFRDYPLGEARDRVAKGEPAVIRFKMPVEGPIRTIDALRGEAVWDAKTLDDFVIRKSDGFPPYHLAAVVDDHDMKISHVLRGDDWLPSFPKHVCLVQALGWEQPVWVHVPNVLGNDGKKLSKRHGANPLIGPAPEYKDGKPTGGTLKGMINQEGYLPEALANFLSLIGWSPGDNREVMTAPELLRAFSLDGVSTAPGKFDITKLDWMNGVYIRQLSPPELVVRALPFLREAGLLSDAPTEEERAYAAEAVALEQEKYKRLDEVPGLVSFFFGDLPEYNEDSVRKLLRKNPEATAAFLADLAGALGGLSEWTVANIEAASREAGAKHGREKGDLTHPVRVAVSGREQGPGLFEMMATLGRERVLKRLARAGELTARG